MFFFCVGFCYTEAGLLRLVHFPLFSLSLAVSLFWGQMGGTRGFVEAETTLRLLTRSTHLLHFLQYAVECCRSFDVRSFGTRCYLLLKGLRLVVLGERCVWNPALKVESWRCLSTVCWLVRRLDFYVGQLFLASTVSTIFTSLFKSPY